MSVASPQVMGDTFNGGVILVCLTHDVTRGVALVFDRPATLSLRANRMN